jgi:hypothetical protein
MAEVQVATPFSAEVGLGQVTAGADLKTGWAFITEHAFGSLETTVVLEGTEDSPWRRAVVDALTPEAGTSKSYVSLVQSGADVVVRNLPENAGVVMETREYGGRLLGPIDAMRNDVGTRVAERLKAFTKNRYLRNLRMQTEGLRVELKLVPCELKCDSQRKVCSGESCECVSEGSLVDLLDEGNDLRLEMGTGFGLRLENVGSQPAYVSVLDLMPNGDVSVIWPLPGSSIEDTKISAGKDFRIQAPNKSQLVAYRACPPFGTDTLKVIATTRPVDFGPITRGRTTRGGVRGPFDLLFEDTLSGARGPVPSLPSGTVSTSSINLTVVEKR